MLCLLAFLTNPVPDPSFPWATVPASLRLPISQPRIEHRPVSYTVGIWLWIAGFSALFLAGYRRYGATRRDAAHAVAALGVIATLLALWRTGRAWVVLVTFGVLAFPLGLPARVASEHGVRPRDCSTDAWLV